MRNFLNKIKLKYIILTLFIILLIILIIFYYKRTYSLNKDYTKINLNDIENLMIIAHPGDEVLWAGAHLLEDNYLVVCISCSSNTTTKEFIKVISNTNDSYLILDYPETIDDEIINWTSYESEIKNDLEKIINLKEWSKIVTHNPDGEYGHIQHKFTSQLVTSIINEKNLNNLYYFGKYYSKKTISNYYEEIQSINNSLIAKKENLIGIYKSQSYIQTTFNHIFNYEDWIKATEWEE